MIQISLEGLQNGAYPVGHAKEHNAETLEITLGTALAGYDYYKVEAVRKDKAKVESDELVASSGKITVPLQAKFLVCSGKVSVQVFGYKLTGEEITEVKGSDVFNLSVSVSVAEEARKKATDEPNKKHIFPGEVGSEELSAEVNQKLDKADNIADDGTDIYDKTIDASSITRESGKNINNYGNVVDNSKYSYLWFRVPSTGKYIVNSSSSSQCYINIYSSSSFSREKLVSRTVASTEPIECEEGQYVAISAYSTSFTITVTYSDNKSYGLNDTIELSAAMTAQVDGMIKSKTDAFYHDGYELLGGTWVRGDWDGWAATATRSFRARRVEPIEFDSDVFLVAEDGFYIFLYAESGTISSANNVALLPANTPAKITVRRIVEDTSEIANIEVFSKMVKASTPTAGIERLKNTFVDVSMFERVGICGDSYAGGGGIISGITALTWGKNLERQAGITVDIYARSGITIEGWNNNQSVGLPALLAGPKCGLYWMAHGINGTSTAADIGTPEDMTADPKPSTFYGQYAYAIEQIQEYSPNSRIIIAQILGSSYQLEQTVYVAVNTAIRNIAEHFSIPCVRLADDDFYKSKFYTNSQRSNHPVAMTSAGMAMANRRLIAKCIMDNSDYFINYKGV